MIIMIRPAMRNISSEAESIGIDLKISNCHIELIKVRLHTLAGCTALHNVVWPQKILRGASSKSQIFCNGVLWRFFSLAGKSYVSM